MKTPLKKKTKREHVTSVSASSWTPPTSAWNQYMFATGNDAQWSKELIDELTQCISGYDAVTAESLFWDKTSCLIHALCFLNEGGRLKQFGKQLVHWTPEELARGTTANSRHHRKKDTDVRETLASICKSETTIAAGTSPDQNWITCPRCRGTDVAWRQQQTRSADEPATVFLCCRNSSCGKTWRIG